MIYPADYESRIGFAPLRSCVAELCLSRKGRDLVQAMTFSSDFGELNRKLRGVAEMQGLLVAAAELPVSDLHDVAPYLSEIKAERSFMSPRRLWELRGILATAAAVSIFFSDEEAAAACPVLADEFASLQGFPQVVSAIERAINRFGEVKDSASPELAEIRSQKASVSASMASVMRRFIGRAAAEGVLDKDVSPSVRDGRLVVPVAAAMKRKVSGIVHDESATGKTVYIEPAEVVEAGNRLRELELEEKREETRILIGIADFLRPLIPELSEAVEKLGLYDFIRAKALFAIQTGARMPHLEKKVEFEWYHAVHPGLAMALKSQGREVVPLDLTLSDEKRILLISGPNAGGKSVCLKTVGCLQYMMQCGLLPTLYENSHMGVFENLLVDIGDEQSIENDLSTYSSHLRNMKVFLRVADKNTLFLADEMGSGTEPQIGGALAQAILASLGPTGCRGVVTTHYQNLKTFADEAPGFVNGAMLYDRQHLRPLFKLEVGSPGSSFALDIARNTGLPNSVIEEAKRIAGSDYVNLDKYLSDIARDRRYWANKRLSIKEKEHKLEKAIDSAEERAETLRVRRAEILAEARKQATELLEGANARLENTIHEIRKASAEKERTKEVRQDLERFRNDLKETTVDRNEPAELKPRRKKAPKTSAPAPAQGPIAEGDSVRMKDGAVVGKVVAVGPKEAEVVFGALRSRVALSKLVKVSPSKAAKEAQQVISTASHADIRRRQLAFSQEIDVRGMRADEALQAVTYFLDDAVQFGAERVRILHGTGTGALRQAIRQFLNSVPDVAAFADEDVRFGGAGITVVNLR